MITTNSQRRAALMAGIGASFLLATAQAGAHAKLESTTPAADSTVASPKIIQAHFSEAIEPKLSSFKLAASDGNAIAVMSMNDAKHPATLSIMPNAALKPGAYTVTWSVVSDDGHKTHGAFSFIVR
ncbi:MAG: copper homeostasis periplasmic binding protein CopC [Steroidobacterales bacterium]